MVGSLFAQDDNADSIDEMILISGDVYKGIYISEDDNFIYFKPTGWIVEQGVEKYKILSVILSDGTIIFDNNNSLRPTWSYNKPKRSEEHTSELQSRTNLVCRLLLEKKNNNHVLISYAVFFLKKNTQIPT